MSNEKDFHAITRVSFVPTESGGRRTPVKSGYRAQFFYDDRNWEATFYFAPDEWVHPGHASDVYVLFLSQESHYGKLKPEMSFEIREGARTVAEGRVIRALI